MNALEETEKIVRWWNEQKTNPSTARLTISGDVLTELLSYIAELTARAEQAEIVKKAALKVLCTFEKYNPNPGVTTELWWKPNPSKTMAERDEGLSELENLLKGEPK